VKLFLRDESAPIHPAMMGALLKDLRYPGVPAWSEGSAALLKDCAAADGV
jgi:hypothetical protein